MIESHQTAKRTSSHWAKRTASLGCAQVLPPLPRRVSSQIPVFPVFKVDRASKYSEVLCKDRKSLTRLPNFYAALVMLK